MESNSIITNSVNKGEPLAKVEPTVAPTITSTIVKSSATILKGDCLAHMKSLPDKSVDLIICDLPYGCLIGGAGQEKKKRQFMKADYPDRPNPRKEGTVAGCAWDIKIDLEVFWREVKRIRKSDHTPCIHFCTTKFGYELIRSNEKEFRYDLVWDKQRGVSFLSVNKMPMRSHEMIYIFSKAGANYYRKDIDDITKQMKPENLTSPRSANIYMNSKLTRSQGAPNGKRCVHSVITHKKVGVKTQGHPTEKPIDLYKWLIERYSKEGETVLDPTAGSFNSGLASLELKRNYIGIEKDVVFFNKGISKFV